MTYTPLFKKIPVDKEAADKITNLQQDFEKFWLPINKSITPNAEKTLGMRKLQEACMWLTRAVAASGASKNGPKQHPGLCPPSKVD